MEVSQVMGLSLKSSNGHVWLWLSIETTTVTWGSTIWRNPGMSRCSQNHAISYCQKWRCNQAKFWCQQHFNVATMGGVTSNCETKPKVRTSFICFKGNSRGNHGLVDPQRASYLDFLLTGSCGYSSYAIVRPKVQGPPRTQNQSALPPILSEVSYCIPKKIEKESLLTWW